MLFSALFFFYLLTCKWRNYYTTGDCLDTEKRQAFIFVPVSLYLYKVLDGAKALFYQMWLACSSFQQIFELDVLV